MLILSQFLLRAAFGLALAMFLTSPRQVTSGYFRNHLYVLLGMSVLALLAAAAIPEQMVAWIAGSAAGLSYAGAVAWLYENPRAGRALLGLVAMAALGGAWIAAPQLREWISSHGELSASTALRIADAPTAGLLIGATLAAMFLGHWYLNTPTMELAPLRKLVLLVLGAVVARAAVCGAGLTLQAISGPSPQWTFVALRWLSGLIGLFVLGIMTWQTLKIPNTQSATGILYVAVIGVFLGELTSQLLSVATAFPL